MVAISFLVPLRAEFAQLVNTISAPFVNRFKVMLSVSECLSWNALVDCIKSKYSLEKSLCSSVILLACGIAVILPLNK